MVAGFGLDAIGALGSIEIGNGFAGRAKAEGAVCGAGDGEGRVKPRTKETFAILFQNLGPFSKFGKR